MKNLKDQSKLASVNISYAHEQTVMISKHKNKFIVLPDRLAFRSNEVFAIQDFMQFSINKFY
jgi:hypothetical protein